MKCAKCGREIRQIEVCGITITPICQCEKMIRDAEDLAFEQKQKQIRFERLFNNSRLGKRFKQKTFDNFSVTEETQHMYEACKEYAETFDKENGTGLLIGSQPGAGKTHLMAAITNKLLEEMHSIVFLVVPDILQELRNTYGNNKDTEGRLLYGLADCDLLILDDIGAEKTTDWTTEKLYTIINNRYMNNKPVIFTTNCELKELTERLGDRTTSRILEMCDVLEVETKDYRKKIYASRRKDLHK